MAGRILLRTYASLCPECPAPDVEVDAAAALVLGEYDCVDEEPKPKSSPMAEPDDREPNPNPAPLCPDVKPSAEEPVGVALLAAEARW